MRTQDCESTFEHRIPFQKLFKCLLSCSTTSATMLLSDIELNNSDAEVTSHERAVEASEGDFESRRGQEAHVSLLCFRF